jgi:hypothetical protein
VNFERVVAVLNRLLARHYPQTFNSSWIRRHAPACYYFIHKRIRAEVGGIDWDRVTCALERKYQRLWNPRRRRQKRYRSTREINLVLNKYREKLYVFIETVDGDDLLIRERIAISLVRLAQSGNVLGRLQLLKLVRYTVDAWLDTYPHMSRWKGRTDEIRRQLEGCIRRYRYTGSFFNYIFRTLACAGRGLQPMYLCSLDASGRKSL